MSFTELRLDLKTAGILHDEEYVPPVIPLELTKSETVKKLEKNNPFN